MQTNGLPKHMANTRAWILRAAAAAAVLAAEGCVRAEPHVLTFSGSRVGREGDVIRRQLDRLSRGASVDQGGAARHAGRRGPAASALRAMAQRPGERSRRPAARRRVDAGVRGRRMDCQPRSVRSARRSVLRRRRRRRSLERLAVRACRGSSTSACCTGGPIWCRVRRAISTISSQLARRAAGRARRAVRVRLAGRPLRRAGDGLSRAPRRVRRRDPRRSRAGSSSIRRRPSRR